MLRKISFGLLALIFIGSLSYGEMVGTKEIKFDQNSGVDTIIHYHAATNSAYHACIVQADFFAGDKKKVTYFVTYAEGYTVGAYLGLSSHLHVRVSPDKVNWYDPSLIGEGDLTTLKNNNFLLTSSSKHSFIIADNKIYPYVRFKFGTLHADSTNTAHVKVDAVWQK